MQCPSLVAPAFKKHFTGSIVGYPLLALATKRAAGTIVSEIGYVKTSARAKLVEDVFLRYLDARRAFNLALERCALKGWPDRGAAISGQSEENHHPDRASRA